MAKGNRSILRNINDGPLLFLLPINLLNLCRLNLLHRFNPVLLRS